MLKSVRLTRLWIVPVFLLVLFFAGRELPAQEMLNDSLYTHNYADTLHSPGNQRSDLDGFFLRVVWVTFLILGMIVGAYYIYKRRFGKQMASSKSRIKVIARHNLGTRQALLMIVAEHQKLLIGMTEHSINLIRDMGPASADDMKEEITSNFPDNFATVLQRLRKEA